MAQSPVEDNLGTMGQLSGQLIVRFLAIIALFLTPFAFAQESSVPTVEIIKWSVNHVIIYDRNDPSTSRSEIMYYRHLETDLITILVEVQDWDWRTEGENEEIFIRFLAYGDESIAPPEPTPISETSTEFIGGFAPPDGQIFFVYEFNFHVPHFLGTNQRRQRGEIDWDVEWQVEFATSNEEGGEIVRYDDEVLRAIENPLFGPSNPPAFADAGSDQLVKVGATVILNGSKTFDGFGVGFFRDDPDVFVKDTFTFTWEWMSGPQRVDPDQGDPHDPYATVVLNVPGIYVYRLLVDDNVNPLPTTDSVKIKAVLEIPANRPPVAIINGPTQASRWDFIELNASASYDPDYDDLTYRWIQMDKSGNPLPLEWYTLLPLSGVNEPVLRWQAVMDGRFYLRLLVSDSQLSMSKTHVIEIKPDTHISDDPPHYDPNEPSEPPVNPPLCGYGIWLLGIVPLGFRRRKNVIN